MRRSCASTSLIQVCASMILMLSSPCRCQLAVLPSNGPFNRRAEPPPPLSAPVGSVGPASCTFNGTWYIQGGFNNEAFRPYGHTLDLKTPWYVSQPPWVPLPSSPYAGEVNACIVSISPFPHLNITGPSLVIVGNEIKEQPLMSVLDLTARQWYGNATKATVPRRNKGLIPVGNPNDGKIYVRGGFHSTAYDTMDVYNPKTDSFESRPIPEPPLLLGDLSSGETGVPRARWYGAVWRDTTQSVLYFGGDTDFTFAPAEIFEYKPATDTWSFMRTTGDAPSPRKDHCMTIGSRKVVVFGGQDGQQALSDIYILDLGTSVWTRGTPEFEPRTEMACAMHDDGFLIWGGARDILQSNLHDSEPLVFNLTKMTWSYAYKSDEVIVPDVVPTDSVPPSLALILGLVIGMIALATICFGCCLYQREKRKTDKNYGHATGQGTEGSLKSSMQPPLRSSSPSPSNHPHEPLVPRAVHRTRGQADNVRHTSRQRRESYSNSGSSVEDDRDYVEEEGRFRQGRSNRHPSGRSARDRSRGVQEIGHKIELTYMDSTNVERPPTPTSYDKEEDASFKPPSMVRPAPAPAVALR
ncbi:acyl-CoA-binding domain-containing protein 4 [Mortierella alpina]|uniref:Acyl-CoA-binding domain-containing protein 4 n=1 Tax=Mortierella alpina TaxID=64518 RepID=A0A9P6M611_MORAP|nr:acyl-CoA-binding domain-containing protein 4 [Mortierella alpina]